MGAAADDPTSSGAAADRSLAAVLVAWLLWVALATVGSERALLAGLPYLVFPIALAAGVVLGRLSARSERAPLMVAVATAPALALLVVDLLYTNAQAAFGVQLVALAGLALPAAGRAAPAVRPA